MADNFRVNEITFLQQQNASIFLRMEKCEHERDEALALVKSWRERRADFEKSFELTKNKLKSVKDIMNNNSSEMSLKVEHLAQMAKQNQGLLTVLEQLETSKREIEVAERERKEKMTRLAVIEREFKSAKEEASQRAQDARAQLLKLKEKLRSEGEKGSQKRTDLMNLEARVKVDIEALEQAVQVVKQKNLEYVTRCNRDDQVHAALESERVELQRELDELRELRVAKQKELKTEQDTRDQFGRGKAVLMKEIDQEESLLLSRKSALASAETTSEQIQQSLRAQDRNIREAADKTYALMDSLRAENVEYKKAESEDTSQEKRVRNLEKTCQNHTAKINIEITGREAAEAEAKVKDTESGGIKRKNKKLEEGIAEAQRAAERKQKEIRGLLAEVNAVQAKNATLSSRIDAGEEEINGSRGQLAGLEETCKELTESCSDLRSRISMANASNGQHRAKVQQLKNELAFIRREDGLDESGRQRPILIHSNDSTLVEKLQIKHSSIGNSFPLARSSPLREASLSCPLKTTIEEGINHFLYEAQQQRNPVPMLIEKIAQLLEVLHFEQKSADSYLGDLAKSNSLVANLRQLNLDLTGKKSTMTSFKTELIGNVVQNQIEASAATEMVLTGLLMQDGDLHDVMGLIRANGCQDQIYGVHLGKNLIDDNATTTLLTMLHELSYLKYIDLRENQLSKEALKMVESQLRAMDGVTQTAHTADGVLEVRSGNQIRLKVNIGEQGVCRPEATAQLINIIDSIERKAIEGTGGGQQQQLRTQRSDEEVKNYLEGPSGVPVGLGGPGDLSALDHQRSAVASQESSVLSGGRRYSGGKDRSVSRKESFPKPKRKATREQLPPVVERAPDPKVLDKWQAGTYTKSSAPE
ncbi:hypothetical protein FOL47_001953 [Perkinsus chesapeaki]|uniref:Uncharacterized protein n=1 Tax=Perkinsus chesapeaki TaxID=330153 RepID=A0A7J6N191_PERCH|nr:hypothetical protein FOL47_001953 [Perkinsus chesapeaki]